MVFDTLVTYDATKREFTPGLAASWKRIDPLTMEFKIRDGVTWHDGQPFTMDDVEYTYNFTMDPKVRYRFKATRINWIAGFQRVDDKTFRIKSKVPMAVMLAKMTNWPAIFPKHIHGKLAADKKNTFGRNAVGTGPYRATSYDPSTGINLVLNKNYSHANAGKPAGNIGKAFIRPIPSEQTQIAELLTDNIDLMYNMDKDSALQIAQNPAFNVEVQDSVSFSYIMFDAKGRSGNMAFTDPKVRRAFLHAINRKDLRHLIHPAIKRELSTVCHPWVQGCASSVNPPAYNPDLAKKMLQEAGFDFNTPMPIVTWGEARATAEAVAGQLRKIGVKGTVQALTFGAFIKTRAKGVPLIVTLWDNSVGQPDIDNTASYFYLPSSRNYNKDPDLEKLAIMGRAELTPGKRTAIYRQLFDESMNRSYLMPLIPLPAIVAYRNTVKMLGGHKNPKGFEVNRVAWR
ncbi:MAG: ABC transporter substrate-binding protein [Proteobacteria bacterium]|nr:ABC transporter substrate-binding protein [Pseudomonadota bacterium]